VKLVNGTQRTGHVQGACVELICIILTTWIFILEVEMSLPVELEQETDGRWIAEIPALPGVMCYGETPQEAAQAAQALALRVLAEQLEQGQEVPEAVRALFLVPA
jgi:predicted RNase H-like HicB family nuclease